MLTIVGCGIVVLAAKSILCLFALVVPSWVPIWLCALTWGSFSVEVVGARLSGRVASSVVVLGTLQVHVE